MAELFLTHLKSVCLLLKFTRSRGRLLRKTDMVNWQLRFSSFSSFRMRFWCFPNTFTVISYFVVVVHVVVFIVVLVVVVVFDRICV